MLFVISCMGQKSRDRFLLNCERFMESFTPQGVGITGVRGPSTQSIFTQWQISCFSFRKRNNFTGKKRSQVIFHEELAS